MGKSKASVRALTYCDLHAIERNDAFYILRAYPEFQHNFVKNLQITFDLRDTEVVIWQSCLILCCYLF